MIVLSKNIPTEVTFFLYQKLDAAYSTPYYGIVLESDMAGDNQKYIFTNLTDLSQYPLEYNTFSLTADGSWLSGDYSYSVRYLLQQDDDPETQYAGQILEYGKLKILDPTTETVFNTNETKNQKVFDED